MAQSTLIAPSGKRGYFDEQIGNMVLRLSKQLREIERQIPENQKAIQTFLKDGFPSSKHDGKLVYSFKDLSAADRLTVMKKLNIGTVSTSTMKGLPRLIASLNQTNPDFAPVRMGGIQLDGFADVLDKALSAQTSDEARRIYDTWSSGVRNLAGKLFAGHHAQPLMPMWNALENIPAKLRRGLLQKMKNKYNIDFGEGGLEYLVKWAHREADMTKLADSWLGALGVTTDNRGYLDEVYPHVKKGLSQLTAHASRFGGTKGDFIAPSKTLLKGIKNVNEGFRLLEPFAQAAKDAADQGSQTSNFLRKTLFESDGITVKSPEELKQILNSKEFSDGMAGIKRISTIPPKDVPSSRGQVITGKDLGWGGEVPSAMMMQSDGTAAIDPAKQLLNMEDVPDSLKSLIAAGDTKSALLMARTSRGMPWMAAASIPLGHWALQAREAEVAANPNDHWLKANLWLDRASLTADYGSVATYGAAISGYGAAAPIGMELTSNITAGLSGALDLQRWIKDPQAREETAQWWTDVYNRGTRGLLKGAQRFF